MRRSGAIGRRARFRTWFPFREWRFESSLRHCSSLIAKIADPGQVEHLGRQFQGPALKAANIAGALDQVARLTTAHLPVLCAVALEHPVYHLRSDAGSPALGIALKNPGILFRAGRS